MTLGEHITTLRNHHHMSQGDLADRLNVSRQSVSKWETNTSVPDLDKLITLSEIFGITLDELVKGPQPEPTFNAFPATEETTISGGHTTKTPQSNRISDTQRILGFILIAAGLVIGWIILIPAFFILPYMTGITPLGILHMLRHLGDAKINLSLLLALLYWICVLIMAILTWRAVRKKARDSSRH